MAQILLFFFFQECLCDWLDKPVEVQSATPVLSTEEALVNSEKHPFNPYGYPIGIQCYQVNLKLMHPYFRS